jgi:hypothetical protein
MPYTKQHHPGKFEGCYSEWLGEVLYEVTMLTGEDESLGEVDGFGWYALIHGKRWSWIVHEDSQGFFDYDQYKSKMEAVSVWCDIQDDYDDFIDDADDFELDA